MEQTPTTTPTAAPKGRKTGAIALGVVLIVIIVIAGLYFGGYLFPPSTGPTTTVSIFETTIGTCGTPTECGYNPTPVNVTTGTTVTWRNDGTVVHTATACSPGTTACPTTNLPSLPNFEVPAGTGTLSGGQSGSFKFETAGTYYYYCEIHTFMHGTVNVS